MNSYFHDGVDWVWLEDKLVSVLFCFEIFVGTGAPDLGNEVGQEFFGQVDEVVRNGESF